MLSIKPNRWFYRSTKIEWAVRENLFCFFFFSRLNFHFSGSDLYHTCYCLSGLSLFQDGGQDQTPIICGGTENQLVRNFKKIGKLFHRWQSFSFSAIHILCSISDLNVLEMRWLTIHKRSSRPTLIFFFPFFLSLLNKDYSFVRLLVSLFFSRFS